MASKEKFSEERLEKSKEMFLEPRVEAGINHGTKQLRIEKDASGFINAIATIDMIVERHIINNCANAEEHDVRVKCIADAENIKSRALNRLSEELSTVCDLKMEYR